MKKITLLLLTACTAFYAKAQFIDASLNKHEAQMYNKSFPLGNKLDKSSTFYNKTNSLEHYYYNFTIATAADFSFNNGSTVAEDFTWSSIPIFPDSTVVIAPTTGAAYHTYAHKFGVVIFPGSPYFQNDLWTQFTPYTLDTISLAFNYKIENGSVKDTMLVEIVWADPTKTNNAFQGGTSNYSGVSYTMDFIMNQKKTTHGNPGRVTSSNKRVIKRVLTDADSSNTLHYGDVLIEGGQVIPAGNAVGIAVSFIPGYTYSKEDTLLSGVANKPAKLNSFSAIYLQDNNFSTNAPSNVFADDNSSNYFSGNQMLYTENRYSLFTGGQAFLNNSLSGNYNVGFLISMGFNADITGVKELSSEGLKLSQNMPNPFSASTSIRYDLAENSNVLVELFDITGKKIMSMNEGKQTAGSHSLIVNADQLNNGVYFYTFTANNSRLTGKMNVIK